MAIKIIGLDIDGTLINSNKKITPRTVDALMAAAERGVYIVPVTGRPLCGMPGELKKLPCIEYIISNNGASTWKNGSLISSCRFSAADCAALLRAFGDNYCIAEVYIDGMGYESQASFVETRRRFEGTPMMDYFIKSRRVVDLYKMLDEEQPFVEEVSVMCNTDEEFEKLTEVIKDFPQLKYSNPLPYYMEIIAADSGKGNALLQLGRRLGIDISEIMAFGDSDNDAGMIRKAGFPVAMGNAAEKLKKLARFITEDNDHDGIAVAVERFVLSENAEG